MGANKKFKSTVAYYALLKATDSFRKRDRAETDFPPKKAQRFNQIRSEKGNRNR